MFILGRLKHFIIITLVVLIVLFFRWNGRISLLESIVYLVAEKSVVLSEITFLPYGGTEELKSRLRDEEMEKARLLNELASAHREILKLKLEAGVKDYSVEYPHEGRTARIIARSPVTWYGEVVVDVGTDDGVREGDIALAAEGLAGIVTETLKGNSVVRLISGKGVAVSGLSVRGETNGIIVGNGAGGLNMTSIPSNSDIKEADIIITSGIGGAYPAGFPVGTVTRVQNDEKMLSPEVAVKPAADMNNLYYLLLVRP